LQALMIANGGHDRHGRGVRRIVALALIVRGALATARLATTD
jgi:hypothetical protein